MADTIYILADTLAECVMPDGTTREVTIERPNDKQKPYEVIRRKLRVQEGYRDPLFRPRDGYNKFELEFILTWERHRMNLTPLIIAERINLKIPTYLYKDNRYYASFNVQFINDELYEKPLLGFKVGKTDSTMKGANPLANADQVLRFRTDPYEWNEFESALGWFNPVTLLADDGDLIIGFGAGIQTDDTLGLEAVAFQPAEYGSQTEVIATIGGLNYQLSTLKLISND